METDQLIRTLAADNPHRSRPVGFMLALALLAALPDALLALWLKLLGDGVLTHNRGLLLVAAIEIAGLAVAFPVGIGLALVVGAITSYIISPSGNALMLFGGIALVVGLWQPVRAGR